MKQAFTGVLVSLQQNLQLESISIRDYLNVKE